MVSSNESSSSIYVAAVEGGGTSFTCAIAKIGTDNGAAAAVEIVSSVNIPSANSSPQLTLSQACSYLAECSKTFDIRALGIACFGPLGLDTDSDMYGCILPTTPKRDWAGVNVLSPFLEVLGKDMPFKVDTDVNAPAVAEFENFNSCCNDGNISSLAYVTVGTGVGVGLVINGQPVHGMMHPEGGHVCVSQLPGDTFGGYSWGSKAPYRGSCTVEGLCSSVALVERVLTGQSQEQKQQHEGGDSDDPRALLKSIPDDDDLWDHCANALANLCVTLTLLVSIERIVLGGGIMNREILFPMVRKKTAEILNGYIGRVEELSNNAVNKEKGGIQTMEDFIAKSAAGNRAGLFGAIALAGKAYEESSSLKQKDDASNTSSSKDNPPMNVVGFLAGALFGAISMHLFLRRKIR
mmetsp:Transcript_23393/g.35108  ORF Transcript_23393/g.35108 Transcript_23393/m.35108 type:complete len:408 (-) Transcript_23393:115-1338(-)